jgi:hypothetical protein
MNNWIYSDPRFAWLHQHEIQVAAAQARLRHEARLARAPRPLRRRLGTLLITAGEALAYERLDDPCPAGCTA